MELSTKFIVFSTVGKVSKYGVFCGPYFFVFSPNTRKYGPEKTLCLDISHAVQLLTILANQLHHRCLYAPEYIFEKHWEMANRFLFGSSYEPRKFTFSLTIFLILFLMAVKKNSQEAVIKNVTKVLTSSLSTQNNRQVELG